MFVTFPSGEGSLGARISERPLDISVSDHHLLARALGDVRLPSNHGLAHPAHVRAAHILRAVHLAVGDNALPWVRSVPLELYLVMIALFALDISPLPKINLLLSVSGPLEDLLAALGLSLSLEFFFFPLLFVKTAFSLLCLG